MLFSSLANAQDDQVQRSISRALEQVDSVRNLGQYARSNAILDSMEATLEQRHGGAGTDRINIERAIAFQMQGNYGPALSELYKAERKRETSNDSIGLAEVYNNIGAIHHKQRNYDQASAHYTKSIAIYRALDMPDAVAQGNNNIGALYQDQGEPALALPYHRENLLHWQRTKDRGWMGVTYMHLGVCHGLLGSMDSAQTYLERSAAIMEERDSPYHQSLLYNLLGQHQLKAGQYEQARRWCERGLAIAERLDIITFQRNNCECLYRVHEHLESDAHAFHYHKRYIALRDSVFNEENIKELTRLEMNHAFERQQLADSLLRAKQKSEAELRHQTAILKERQERNIAFFTGIGVLLLAGGLWSRLRYIRRSRAEIQAEKDRSEDLLLNILPSETAEELKQTGSSKAKLIDPVTVLFTDFKGFTAVAERLEPEQLVKDLHECFSAFDTVMDKHGVEKIKTIGDSYMAAIGLHSPSDNDVARMLSAALEIRDMIERGKAEKIAVGLPYFEIRIGIHTGPVVAGIVGRRKFSYDIWGDTVNTASRMESSGAVGRVNISGSTYAFVQHRPEFSFEARGKVQAKGKGEIEMYFVQHASGAPP